MTNLAKFRELGLSDATLDALAQKGFEEPSPIQAAAIPLLLSGEKDVIGQAQTGTGKTAAFGIPIIEILKPGQGHVQAIILSPTRELTIQIAEELNSLKGKSPLGVMPVYGGQAIEIQLRRLSQGVDIVVGTPGRILDLIKRRALDISKVKFAVLDEADEMLNMGFIEDIELILGNTPTDKRTLMFSATMPKPILAIAERSMREYELINVRHQQITVDLTEQIYFEVRFEDKLEALSRIIDMEQDLYAMVFCRTKNDVDLLTERLTLRGYLVEALHGDIAQSQRTKVIERFKARQFSILIATDVAARGIDVNNLTHVINYSIPQGTEAYIHRIGRTGRAGRPGTAITFVTPSEFRKLTNIKRDTKSDIRKETLPNPNDIVERKKERIFEKMQSVIETEKQARYTAFANLLIKANGAENTVAALLRMAYKNDLLPESYADIGSKREKSGKVDSRGQTRLFMAIGKEDGYGAKAILDLIYERSGIKRSQIGKIDCFDKFTFINTDFNDAEVVIEAFRGYGRGKTPFVEIAQGKDAAKKQDRSDAPPLKRRGKNEMPSLPPMTQDDPALKHKRKVAPPAWDKGLNSPKKKSTSYGSRGSKSFSKKRPE